MIRILILCIHLIFSFNSYGSLVNETKEYEILKDNYELYENNYYLLFDNLENFKGEDIYIYDDLVIVSDFNENEYSSDIPSTEILKNLIQFKINKEHIFNENEIILILKKHYNKNWIYFNTENSIKSKKDLYINFLNKNLFNMEDETKSSHHKLNFKLNAWIIKIDKNTLYQNHYIYYKPQLYFELGYFLSSIFILIISSFFIIYYLRKKLSTIKYV